MTEQDVEEEVQAEEDVQSEEHKVKGEGLISKIKELIHEGNITRIIIKNDEGRTLIEIPLTLGMVGIALAPVLAAVGAIGALAADLTIVVEKVGEEKAGD
jgi:hypothetical protein